MEGLKILSEYLQWIIIGEVILLELFNNDQNEKIVALQKTFEAAIQAQVKKAGVAKRGALTKEADRRVKVMYEKADPDQNGKIDFAGMC